MKWTVVLITAWFVCCGPTAARRIYPVYPTTNKIVMDGNVDSPTWVCAPVAGDFFPVGKAPMGQSTQFRMLYDASGLYVAIKASERSMSLLQLTKCDGDNVWVDDAIELFFSVDAGRTYQRFAVNAAGRRSDLRLIAGASQWSNGWALTIYIPFDLFLSGPDTGQVIFGNICRSRRCAGSPEFSAWNWVENSFHETSGFAEFLLRRTPVSAEKAACMSDLVNLEYEMTLTDNARDIMRHYEWLEQGVKHNGAPSEDMPVAQLIADWQTRRNNAARYLAYVSWFKERRNNPELWEGSCKELINLGVCPAATNYRLPLLIDGVEQQVVDYILLKDLFNE